MLNERQTAIALAALRYAQANAHVGIYEESLDLEPEMDEVKRLERHEEIASEIDEICEEINCPAEPGDLIFRKIYFPGEVESGTPMELAIYEGNWGPYIEFAHPGQPPICQLGVDFYANKLRGTVNDYDPDRDPAEGAPFYKEETEFVHTFTEDWTNFGPTK